MQACFEKKQLYLSPRFMVSFFQRIKILNRRKGKHGGKNSASRGSGTKKTYDLTAFRSRFGRKVMTDDLYLGYYLHLVQDLLFRGFIYGKYNWDPHTDGNIDRLHDDYRKANTYLSKRHGLTFNIVLPENLNAEEMSHIAEFKPREFLAEMYSDYKQNSGDLTKASPAFFFTGEMADEFIEIAVDGCLNELNALQKGVSAINETLLAFAW